MRSERSRVVRFACAISLSSAALAACGRTPYHCGPNRECDPGSLCTPMHECARPDPMCPSGFRASDTAANPGQCIAMLMPLDGGDFDSEAPDGSELDATTDSPRVFVDAAPYDGPPVTGDFVIEQFDLTGSRGSQTIGTFTSDAVPSCMEVSNDASCVLRTCPTDATGPTDRPTTFANVGTIQTNLPVFPSIPYVTGIGYSETRSAIAFGVRDTVQISNDGAPGFFAQLVSPGPSQLMQPLRGGTILRGSPVLAVTTEGADLVFVRLEQPLGMSGTGRVLTCWVMPQGGSVNIPADKLSLTSFPFSTATLSVYSARRVALGNASGRSIALRQFTTLADGSRVDRMTVQLSP